MIRRLLLALVLLCAATAIADPRGSSQAAATLTAQQASLCKAIQPFYTEIDNSSGLVWSANSPSTQTAYTAATVLSVASASKFMWAQVACSLAGGCGSLTTTQRNVLNFTLGYIGPPTTNGLCHYGTSGAGNYTSFAACVTDPNNVGVLSQTAGAVNNYYYAGNQLSRYVAAYMNSGSGTGLANMYNNTIGNWYADVRLALGGTMPNTQYSAFDPAGGAFMPTVDYMTWMDRLLVGSASPLSLASYLSTACVHTWAAYNTGTTFSPIPENWDYCLAHWHEIDPTTYGDGAFSSPGGYGFYPWVDSDQQYDGVIAEQQAVFGEGNGYNSAKCGRLIRNAWLTGVAQSGPLPVGVGAQSALIGG